jgi:hypothetical protein
MPFDPRLIHPDEPPIRPDGELDLPPELAALGEQLADDAAHLAVRFPAGAPLAALSAELVESALRIKRHARRRRSLVIAAVTGSAGLASLAVAALTIGLALQDNAHRPDSAESVRSPVALPALARRTDPASPTTPAAAMRPAAAVSIGELSGPELEGLFDLLDESPRSAATISF